MNNTIRRAGNVPHMVGVMMCTVLGVTLGVANADADNTAEPWGSGRSYMQLRARQPVLGSWCGMNEGGYL